jgi:predicted SAM-dependent methyltransferase
MRLNLGCGLLPLEGYVNVDAHAEQADVRGDIRELDFSDVEEVRMDHLLEHLPIKDGLPVLERIRSWMKPGAKITVEVPDMLAIMANPRAVWLTDIYGVQEHPGEFHMAGFSHYSLRHVLIEAGFKDVHSTSFISEHPHRPGLPCVKATGHA